MTSIYQLVRRIIASLLCFYGLSINYVRADIPGRLGGSYSAEPLDVGIRFYGGNEEFYRKVKVLESLSWSIKRLSDDLTQLLPNILLSKASPEVKEADADECRQLMLDVKRVSSPHRHYTELRKMLDEYRAINRGLQREHVTPERLSELRNALKNLVERFKDEEEFASITLNYDNASYYRDTEKRAKKLFRKYKVQTSQSPDSHDQGSSADRGGNATAIDPVLVGGTGGRHIDEGDNAPAPKGGNETTRKLLNDRSLLKTLGDVEEMVKRIEGILNAPLMNHINLYTADSDVSPYNAVILDIQNQYDTYCDNLRDIGKAWDIYTRYNDITDELRKIDPKSLKASELIEKQQKLEIAFEEYGTLLHSTYLGDINRAASNILGMLECVEEELNKIQSTHSMSKLSSQTTEAKEPTPPAQAPKAIDTPPKPHPSKSEEPAPKPPTSKQEETTPNTPEEPVPPPRTLESQAKAATPPQEVKPETENTKTSETIPEREPNGPTTTPNRHPGKTEVVSAPLTNSTEPKLSTSLPHSTKANDTTPPPQESEQQEPTPSPEPTNKEVGTTTSKKHVPNGTTIAPKENKPEEQTPRADASKQQEPTPKLERTSMQGTGGGKTTGGLDTSQTTEGNVGNIRDTKDSKMSSGHLIIGRTVIQIMVAVVLMAAL
ncbi:cellulosome anchoring cohesin region containing protein, putative [Babesia ovata]|uniref:Cellulosome anchoring cohesin region containing protein, putative n=1 Tax=Babesia ovata TaxID=189622 RepID=A0A2H6KF45_9APIC|nr:cellulosome anchoring cohesin region containing protein, putative [Babesia ovata]GBE61623.1 cellulosome anchoring cohesin region containing protein, putative [Babesia ovata]